MNTPKLLGAASVRPADVKIISTEAVQGRGCLRLLVRVAVDGIEEPDWRCVQDGDRKPWAQSPRDEMPRPGNKPFYRERPRRIHPRHDEAIKAAVVSAWLNHTQSPNNSRTPFGAEVRRRAGLDGGCL